MNKELLRQTQNARKSDLGIMVMPQFHEPKMQNGEANKLPWDTFRTRLDPIGSLPLHGSDAEVIFVPKHVAWSAEDINTFVGSDSRTINEIDDLTASEAQEWIETNFAIAQQLATKSQPEVQINIGFNVQDRSVGHHSLDRLHSHIRRLHHPLDEKRRRQMDWNEFDWFDKLAFVEPFAVIHHDYLAHAIATNGFDGIVGEPKLKSGYSSILLDKNSAGKHFPQLQTIYSGMDEEYQRIENIFTDKSVNDKTGRYNPKPRDERVEGLVEYLETNKKWLSETSADALMYLAENIKDSLPRDPKNPRLIDSAETAYATRGFAGAITYTVGLGDTIRFDFLPRVITTSGATKTLSGIDTATVIAKEKTDATSEDRQVMSDYINEVSTVLKTTYPGRYSSMR